MNEMKFGDLTLSPQLMKDLKHNGFESPMAVQALAIPILMEGRDLMVQAKTGTGKTLAFGIPIIERTDVNSHDVQTLILAPTRELAEQVSGEMRKIGYNKRVKIAAVYGGKSINSQAKMLQGGAQVVVGTPGRILDMIDRRILRLQHVKILVLDEADRMLDMGFIDDIKKIMSHVPGERQTMLFSATIPDRIQELARRFMRNPEMISVSPEELTVAEIEQYYYERDSSRKFDAFMEVIMKETPSSAIVFCNTKRWAETLGRLMRKKGLRTEALHGDLTQGQRDHVMEGFRNRRFEFLVATDVAARGLDIDDVSHIFNYDIPREKENYIHRIGRTGRAGKKGKAITFIAPHEIHDLWGIEHVCRTKIQQAMPSDQGRR